MAYFNPEHYIPTDAFLRSYERALMDLSDRDLAVWLMHRAGTGQCEIARRMETSQPTVQRILARITLYLRTRIHRDLHGEAPAHTFGLVMRRFGSGR